MELVAPGATWYDRQAARGGRGVIDLAMHLLELNFKQAVQRLCEADPAGSLPGPLKSQDRSRT